MAIHEAESIRGPFLAGLNSRLL